MRAATAALNEPGVVTLESYLEGIREVACCAACNTGSKIDSRAILEPRDDDMYDKAV